MNQAFSTPSLYETFFLIPMMILSVFACVPLTIKVLNKNREPSNELTLFIGLIGTVLAALAVVVLKVTTTPTIYAGALIFDKMAMYANLGVLGIVALSLLLSKSGVNTKGNSFAEHTFLILLSA